MQDDIPVTLITDNMSGHVMKKGRVQAVVVGADRIAANGDVANKIGTYMVAVLARQPRHSVLCRRSAFDRRSQLPDRRRRSRSKNATSARSRTSRTTSSPRKASRVSNYAFDVTPNELVTAIITEKGVARAPYAESFEKAIRVRTTCVNGWVLEKAKG